MFHCIQVLANINLIILLSNINNINHHIQHFINSVMIKECLVYHNNQCCKIIKNYDTDNIYLYKSY